MIPKKLRPGRKNSEEGTAFRKHVEIGGSGFTWTSLQNPDRRDMEGLAGKYGLNMLNVEDCLTKFELAKLDTYDNHIFLILHLPPLASKRRIPVYSQLSIFIGRDFLITVHQGDLKPLVDLIDMCENGTDPARSGRLLHGSAYILLHEIIDVLVDDLLHTMRRIMANIDDIEEGAFDERRSVAKKISRLRREIIMLRRIVVPLKRITVETGRQVARLSASEDLLQYFDDVIDHIDKVLETLEESRETMEIYKDTDYMLSTEKTNKVLAALTIIFTLAIPATIVGTFYGMNINLPGGTSQGGDYTMFVVILLASIIPAAIMYACFRKLGWLNG